MDKDRLIQGIDEDTGRPFVLFGKVRVQTLPGGRYRVEDEGAGRIMEFADRKQALAAAGVHTEMPEVELSPEAAIKRVSGIVSEVELMALDRTAERLGITREAAVRRAIAEFVVRHLG